MASNKDRAKHVRRMEVRGLEIGLMESLVWLSSLNEKLAEGLMPTIKPAIIEDLEELLGRYRSFDNPTLRMQFMHTGINAMYGEVRKYYDKPNKDSKPEEMGLNYKAIKGYKEYLALQMSF